jgi:gluconokinase
MNLALIIDVGTTNVKVGAVTPEGEVVARESAPTPSLHPERGAFEHDPEALLRVISELSREVTRPRRDSIAFLGLSGYQFGFLPLDASGEPLTGMMTLLDDRPKRVMEHIRTTFPVEEIYRRTGCPPLFTYTLSKLVWLQKELPDVFAKADRFADLKSFLLERLTGQFVTEPSIASATQLLNIHDHDWDDEMLAQVGIDRSALPDVVPGEQFIGTVTTTAAEALGIPNDTPVLPGLYDGGAMILGMGGVEEEVAVCNLGTTAMVRGCATAPVLDDPAQMRLQTYALMDGLWAVGGAMNNAGVALQWYRDKLDADATYEEIMGRAEQVEPGAEGLFCLPFLTGERDPRIGDAASGAFFGLKEFHSGPHVARSILEGVAYGLRMVQDAVVENGFSYDRMRIGGSGARSALWSEIVANTLDVSVEHTRTPDAALVGEAMLGFTALGTYDDLTGASDAMVRVGASFHPTDDLVETYRRGYDFFEDLVETMSDLYQRHAETFG